MGRGSKEERPERRLRRLFALRRWRLALPSTLTALVVFSFTLLALGVGVYAAALPSLFAQAQADGELFDAAEEGPGGSAEGLSTGDRSLGADSDGADDGSSGADDDEGVAAGMAATSGTAGESQVNAGDTASGDGSSSSGTLTLGGSSLGSLSLTSSGGADGGEASTGDGTVDDGDADAAGSGTSSDSGSGSGTSSDGSGTSSDGSGSGSNSNSASGSDSSANSFSNDPDPADEAAAREFFAAKASAVDGYVSEVNACVAEFNADALSVDYTTRQAHLYACEALASRLLSEWSQAVNYVPISNKSAYKGAQSKVIVMYRCLATYVGCYQDAWAQNLAFEDPTGHEAEFTAPLTDGTADSAMAEFQSAYEGFSL